MGLLSSPTIVFAHEKWFLSEMVAQKTPDLFTRLQFTNILMIVVTLVFFCIALVLNRRLSSSKLIEKAHKDLDKVAAWGVPVVRLTVGLLMFTASYLGFFFAPELTRESFNELYSTPFLYIQAFVGLMLVIGVLPRFSAFSGLVLFTSLFSFLPWQDLLPYTLYIGIFLYLMILGDSSLPKVKSKKKHTNFLMDIFAKLEPQSLGILRLGLAVSLIVPALSFKIINPQIALAFLDVQPINFMQGLGFASFSNGIFVLAAGLIEVLLGLLLMINALPRLIGGILIFVFTLTLTCFGMFELLGHLPFYGAAYAILVQAKSSK